MKNIYSILNEIEIEIEQNRDSVLQKVPLIDKAIFLLLLHIKKSASIEEANKYFDLLEKFQFIIAKFFFKERIELPENLCNFVKDFDRIDDLDVRKILLKKYKKKNTFFRVTLPL